MIIWVLLFFIVIFISLFLAFRSMRDYTEAPVHTDTHYSLYLIKNEAGLTDELLMKIDHIIDQKRLIVSLERLYRGSKQALVIYGPVIILKQFADILNLVELEDYSLKYSNHLQAGILAWEVSSKDFHKSDKPIAYQKSDAPIIDLANIPLALSDQEELWWQLVIQPKCEKNGLQPIFKALIRVVVIAGDNNKAQEIKSKIDNQVKQTNLLAIPQSYSSEQIIKNYQKRSLPQHLLDKEGGHFIVGVDDIKDLLS
ncbi:MAG: hypothetical protein PHQ59_04660 [Candidatus Daviesbacteria bacterium]|nr:hypothetical protein [Candidatus Daviesbacteria bacterium]